MYTKRVLCKYFMHGACFKGDACEFSHNWSDQASNVCTFYQKGLCSYGSRCRYDHIKPSQPQRRAADISSSSGTSTDLKKPMSQFGDSSGTGYLGYSAMDPTAPPWSKPCDKEATSVVGESHQYEVGIFDDPAEAPICAFAAAGECPRGESCVHLHGDLCPTCGKRCLHPFRPSERKEHAVQCERNQRRLEALRRSQEIECSICLERVLSKPTVTERKFGLLSGCNHAFCVPCIRGWRSSVQPPSIDVDAVLRTCPVCRVLSYYVIPSVIWYFSPEEKQEIVNGYKSKLSSLDCKHFDFGNGHCPFGTSCFYKHGYRDGRVEEVRLRHLSAADGDTVIAKEVRLSEFLNRMDLRG